MCIIPGLHAASTCRWCSLVTCEQIWSGLTSQLQACMRKKDDHEHRDTGVCQLLVVSQNILFFTRLAAPQIPRPSSMWESAYGQPDKKTGCELAYTENAQRQRVTCIHDLWYSSRSLPAAVLCFIFSFAYQMYHSFEIKPAGTQGPWQEL